MFFLFFFLSLFKDEYEEERQTNLAAVIASLTMQTQQEVCAFDILMLGNKLMLFQCCGHTFR